MDPVRLPVDQGFDLMSGVSVTKEDTKKKPLPGHHPVPCPQSRKNGQRRSGGSRSGSGGGREITDVKLIDEQLPLLVQEHLKGKQLEFFVGDEQ